MRSRRSAGESVLEERMYGPLRYTEGSWRKELIEKAQRTESSKREAKRGRELPI